MRTMLGYMLTWTTYGSWLQGDERGYVKDGVVRAGEERLRKVNEWLMVQRPVVLGQREQEIVGQAIAAAAKERKQELYAIAVKGTHVHLVLGWIDDRAIGTEVCYYKNAGRWGLKDVGWKGRLWTGGYDKLFCFDEKELRARIEYVRRHDGD